VPVVISGLSTHVVPAGHGLWLRSEGESASFTRLVQGNENEFWQTNFDREWGTYTLVYNVKFFENTTVAFGSDPGTWNCPANHYGDGLYCTACVDSATSTVGSTDNTACTCQDQESVCVVQTNACTSNAGYEWVGVTCSDIDECTVGTGNCATNAECTNTAGGFSCACQTGYEGDGATCAATTTCSDGVQDGDETGVDCGGSCAACQTSTCDDGAQDGNETGVVCGGSCAACQTSTCDGIQNGNETGVDCCGSCWACLPQCLRHGFL